LFKWSAFTELLLHDRLHLPKFPEEKPFRNMKQIFTSWMAPWCWGYIVIIFTMLSLHWLGNKNDNKLSLGIAKVQAVNRMSAIYQ